MVEKSETNPASVLGGKNSNEIVGGFRTSKWSMRSAVVTNEF